MGAPNFPFVIGDRVEVTHLAVRGLDVEAGCHRGTVSFGSKPIQGGPITAWVTGLKRCHEGIKVFGRGDADGYEPGHIERRKVIVLYRLRTSLLSAEILAFAEHLRPGDPAHPVPPVCRMGPLMRPRVVYQ